VSFILRTLLNFCFMSQIYHIFLLALGPKKKTFLFWPNFLIRPKFGLFVHCISSTLYWIVATSSLLCTSRSLFSDIIFWHFFVVIISLHYIFTFSLLFLFLSIFRIHSLQIDFPSSVSLSFPLLLTFVSTTIFFSDSIVMSIVAPILHHTCWRINLPHHWVPYISYLRMH